MHDPRDDEPETPEAAAATRKVMALIATSLVSVIDGASYLFMRGKPGMLAVAGIPMAIVTVAVFIFAWLMLRKQPAV